jgi:alpha-tubulin suppressor-like RCC1 family protein
VVTLVNAPTAQPVVAGQVVEFDLGGNHGCAVVDANGTKTLRCWGENDQNQIDGTGSDYAVPVEVAVANPEQVALGLGHTCVLQTGGTVLCWGRNREFQTGVDNAIAAVTVPTKVEGLGVVRSVAASENHSCAIDVEDQLFCWGSNNQGQLGNEDVAETAIPQLVAGLPPVAEVGLGADYTCIRGQDRSLWCWGLGTSSRLGDGIGGNRPNPLPVQDFIVAEAIDDAAQLSVGFAHSCVIREDEQVYCWGKGGSGQIGDGATSARDGAVQVINLGCNQ